MEKASVGAMSRGRSGDGSSAPEHTRASYLDEQSADDARIMTGCASYYSV